MYRNIGNIFVVRPPDTGGLKASVHITSTYQETTKQSPVSTVFTPMFEKTYFTYFSDFKKHDFLRFLDGASKSHKNFLWLFDAPSEKRKKSCFEILKMSKIRFLEHWCEHDILLKSRQQKFSPTPSKWVHILRSLTFVNCAMCIHSFIHSFI